MYYKLLFLIAVCVKIARSDDCTEAVPADMPYDLLDCCMADRTFFKAFSDDPCIKTANNPTVVCVVKCLYENHGLMVNDSIVIENVKQYLPIEDEVLKASYISAYEFCDKFGKQNIIDKFGHMINETQCEGYYLLFDICAALNAFTRCPVNLLKKTNYCTSQLDFLNQCVFNVTNSR